MYVSPPSPATLFFRGREDYLQEMRGSRSNPSRRFLYGSIVPRITEDPVRSCTLQSRRFRSCVPPDFGFLAPSLLATDTLPGLRRGTVLLELFHADFAERILPLVQITSACMIIPDARRVRLVERVLATSIWKLKIAEWSRPKKIWQKSARFTTFNK